jgi:hypothetical protein
MLKTSEQKLKFPQFDRWTMIDANHVTLEETISAIGAGHLDTFLRNPEEAFGGNGIVIKMTLPSAITTAFIECSNRGEKLHVTLIEKGQKYNFILAYREDLSETYPFRLALDS